MSCQTFKIQEAFNLTTSFQALLESETLALPHPGIQGTSERSSRVRTDRGRRTDPGYGAFQKSSGYALSFRLKLAPIESTQTSTSCAVFVPLKLCRHQSPRAQRILAEVINCKLAWSVYHCLQVFLKGKPKNFWNFSLPGPSCSLRIVHSVRHASHRCNCWHAG